MSDNYLIHWAKGSTSSDHKYKARKWVNGAWQYIYDTFDYNSAKQQDINLNKKRGEYLNAQYDIKNANAERAFNTSKTNEATTYRVEADKYGRKGKDKVYGTYVMKDESFIRDTPKSKVDLRSDQRAREAQSTLRKTTRDYEAELYEYKKNRKGKFFKNVDTFLNLFGLSIFK